MSGLVGDGAVAGTTEVGVGDEASAEAADAVAVGDDPGPSDRVLHKRVLIVAGFSRRSPALLLSWTGSAGWKPWTCCCRRRVQTDPLATDWF